MNFRSDNEGPAAAPILQALVDANQGTAHAYAEDQWSKRLDEAFSEVFEAEVRVLPLATGTAGNSIALAQLCPPWGSVVCHQQAHINQDECGAPEFYNPGCKLAGLTGDLCKLQADDISAWLSHQGAHGVHNNKPSAISLTQATEAGTVYQLDEIQAISAVARANDLYLHMDGARFANALISLGASAADMTWRSGVDILSFGASKNGCISAEALVLFGHPDWYADLERRRKRAGHLLCKMRYVSAQLLAYLENDLWLTLAAKANEHAARFAAAIDQHPTAELAWPVEGNEVFLRWPREKLQALQDRGFDFYFWPGSDDLARLVFACTHSDTLIDQLISNLDEIQ